MAFERLGVEPLGEDDAHDEANTLRARLGVSPETGSLPPDGSRLEGGKPTAEDYDNALKNLEALRALASTNPDAITVIDQIVAMPLLGTTFLARITKALAGRPSEMGKRWKEGEAITDMGVEAVIGQTVSELLKDRARGEQFGKKEVAH